MISAWTAHLTDDKEKEQFREYLLRSQEIFERLSTLLKQEELSLTQAELSPKMFDTPNWENKQAFFNGYKACLMIINNLIDLKKELHDR